MLEAPQAEPPRASWVRPHTVGRLPHAGESAAYVRRCRHPPTHLHAKRSQPLGSWAGRAVRNAEWAGHVPAVTSPRRPGRRTVRRPASGPAGPRPGLGRTGPTCEDERRRRRQGAGKRKGDEKEKMREKRRLPEAGGVRQRVGQGSAGFGWLRQPNTAPPSSRREPRWNINRLAGKEETKKGLTKLQYALQEILAS